MEFQTAAASTAVADGIPIGELSRCYGDVEQSAESGERTYMQSSPGEADVDFITTKRTTVKIRGLPKDFLHGRLVSWLNRIGFRNKYDFCYIPLDCKTRVSRGFAFVNFLTPEIAQSFCDRFNGKPIATSDHCITCEPAAIQGYEDNFDHFARPSMRRYVGSGPLFLPRQRAGCTSTTVATDQRASSSQSVGNQGASEMRGHALVTPSSRVVNAAYAAGTQATLPHDVWCSQDAPPASAHSGHCIFPPSTSTVVASSGSRASVTTIETPASSRSYTMAMPPSPCEESRALDAESSEFVRRARWP